MNFNLFYYFLLIRDRKLIEEHLQGLLSNGLPPLDQRYARILHHGIKILEGNHLDVIFDEDWGPLDLPTLMRALTKSPDDLREVIISYILDQTDENDENAAIVHLLVLGLSYFEVFLQMNYTGPELPPGKLSRLASYGCLSDDDTDKIELRWLTILECDGQYPFPKIQIPHLLIISRVIFATLANPQALLWRHGIILSVNGDISLPITEDSSASVLRNIISNRKLINSISIYAFRSAMIHVRLLQKQTYDQVPFLWKECQTYLLSMTQTYRLDLVDDEDAIIRAQLLLECGLCYHHFNYKDKVVISSHLMTALICL